MTCFVIINIDSRLTKDPPSQSAFAKKQQRSFTVSHKMSSSEEEYTSDSESISSSTFSSTSGDPSKSCTLYVGKLPPVANETNLREHFTECHIVGLHVIRDKETKLPKGFAFIRLESEEAADRAVTMYHKTRLLGKHPIVVSKKIEKNSGKKERNGKKTRTRRKGSSSSVASDSAIKDADSREKSSHFRLRQHLATSDKYMSSGNVPPPPVPPHSHGPPPPVPPHSHGPPPPVPPHSHGPRPLAPTGVPLLPSPAPVLTTFQPPRGHIHSHPPLPHPVPVPHRPVPHGPIPIPHGPIPVPHGPIPVPHESVPVSHGPVPIPHGPVPVPRKPVPIPRKPIPVPRKPAHVPHVPIPPSPDREGPVAVTLSNIPIEINEPDISDLVSRYLPCSLTVNSHFRTANIVLSSYQVASQVVRDLDGQTLLGSVITASISTGASHHGRRKSSTEARDSDSIKITNLPAGTKREEVMSHFASYGPIDKCFVKKQRQDSNAYYSIVKFKDPRAAINATTCDGSSFKGQPIKVSLKEQQVSDNTNSIIIVSGLSSSTSDSDVFHSFKSYGHIIGKVKITESNPRRCSITYSSRESAERAMREMDHTPFKGSVLSVQHCNNDDNEDDDESDVLVSVGSQLESLLLSSPPPHSARVITETKTMSSELYEFWMKDSESKLEDFKDSGGTIQYSEGVLSLSATSSVNTKSLIKDLSSYTERTLDCSAAQWNQLVLVDELGVCKMDQLKSPFSSLPDVMIVDKTPLKLSFIGRVTAVDSAYYHFFNELGKELTVDSFKIEALLELKDDLCDEILKKYRVRVRGFTLGSTKLIFEGNSSSLSLARSAVETTLSSVKQSPLPSLPAPLMRSALSLCNKEGLNCTVLDHNNQSLLVCLSDDHLQKAERIFKRKPYTNFVRISDADSYPVDLLSNIVKSESVQVELSEDSIFLKGFDKEEVQEARKEIEEFIGSAVKQEEVSCTPEQKAYIKKEFNSAELKSRFPNTVIRKDSICIQGSQEERRQSSMSLLGLVPPFCATVVLECDRRFLSLLEQQVMQPHGIEYIETSDGQRQYRGRGRGGKGGGTRGGGGSNELKLFLYSSRSLDETVDELKELSPCTLRVPVNPKAKDIVKKMKVDIERQCRCRLIINEHPNVLIHSLTKQESQRARRLILDGVKSQLIIFKYLPSPPIPVLHLKYLAEIYKDRFDEVSEGLILFHWPKKRPFHAIGSDETDTIKVKGTGLQVDTVKEFLDEIINENEFCEKRFSLPITFPRYLLSMWRKRWNFLKTYFKERYEVFLEYKIPESVDANSAVEFCLYGFNHEAVTIFENTVASEVSQKINTVEIPLPVERVNAVSTAIREHTLDFKDYSVDVFCNEKARKVVIRAPYFLKDDMDSVQDEIVIFLEATAISKEDVTLPDVPTYLLLTSKEHSYYQRAQSFARTVKVTFRPYRHSSVVGVTLNGTSGQIERFKLELDLIIKAVKSLLGCEYVSVDSLVLPCLTPTFCRDLNSKIEAQFMTVLNKESKSRPSSQTGGWGGKWYWRDDDGSYIPHSASVCKELMSEYKANPKGIHIIIDYDKAIEVDFHSMIQTDLTTGIKRKVKCDSTAGSVQWYWTSDDGTKLVPYSAQESSDIENGFKVKHCSHFRMTINNRLYLIDTASMTQTNEETGNIRRIERRISSGGATQQTVIKLYGLKSQLAAARQHVEEKLSECLKTNEMTNPILKDPQFYQEVQKIASRHNVTLERQGSFSSSLEQKAGAAKPSPGLGRLFFKGVGFCINKVIQEVQERIIESRTATTATAGLPDTPQEWEAQETNLKLFPVQAHSDEYKRVEGLFKTTMPRSYVITITRIQNMWLYEKYVQHRDRLTLKNNGKSNECELFHGTRNTDPKEIFESEEGFDMRFSATGKWGQANYFAVNASYSDSYAHVNASGYREMFLVKLLVGESYDSTPDSSLRMPPKMRVKTGELQTRYDTVTGMTGGSRVYMAYDNQKAYPAYLIRYTSY